MKKVWSRAWKSASQARKQRKHAARAPMHVKRKFLRANLNDVLRKKTGRRSVSVRKGDEVVVKRGSMKGQVGEVLAVEIKKGAVFIKGMTRKKADGTEIRTAFRPSNLQIIKLNLDDKRRIKTLAKTSEKKAGKKRAAKAAPSKRAEKKPVKTAAKKTVKEKKRS